MIIKSVHLRNIRSYTDTKLVFPQGSVLLSGDIGSGKTSILLAIEFALFGTRRLELSGESLLRNGKNEGFVELMFEIEGKEFIIKRSLKRSNEDVKQIAGYLIRDNRKMEGTAIELKSMMLDLLGYPSSLLTKSKDLLFRYTVYTPQEEMKRILFEDKEARVDTLRKVFGIDRYKRIRENALVYGREVKDKKRELQAQIFDLAEKLELKLEKEKEQKGWELQEVALLPSHEQSKQKVLDAKEKLVQVESKMEAMRALKKELDLAEMKLKYVAQQYDQLKKEQDQLKSQLADFEQELSMQAIDATIAEKIPLIKSQILAIEQQGKMVTHKMSEWKTKKLLTHEMLHKVASLDTCPVCRQQVQESYKQEIKKREMQQIEVFDVQIKELEQQEASLLGKLVEQKKVLEQAQEQEKKNALMVYKSKMMQEKKERMALVQLKAEEVKKEIAALRMKKLELQQHLHQFMDLDDRYQKSKIEFEECLGRERKLAIQLAEIKKEKEAAQKMLAVLEKEIVEKTKLKKDIQDLSLLQNYLEKHFMNLVSLIERHVMLSIHQEFNQLFQEWFNMLVESELMSARVDEEFTPIIEQNGYETDVLNLSGGEKTSLALAYRLALNKVINNLIGRIKTKDLLILDEPTDGFSSDQLDKVREVLDQLEAKQIIMVSHEAKIESFVNSIIRIVKEEHVSRVVQG